MGNVNIWSESTTKPNKQCIECKFCSYKWMIEIPEYNCLKKKDLQYFSNENCFLFLKRKRLIDILKIFFYTLIMIFQDEDQLNNNPEWIKFLDSLKYKGDYYNG